MFHICSSRHPHWDLPRLCDALPRIHLRRSVTGEQRFVDEFGRETFFHGSNAVVKGPPWIPSRDGFDPLTSLTAKDFELMKAAGLNVLRLGVMWPGVEPQRGVYNESYLRIVRDIVEEAATYGIYILADMHQDLLSEKFCGEGVPLWAAQPVPVPFPVPLSLPYLPGWDGLPKRDDCFRFESWAAYQASIATVSAYDRLFTNHDNLTNAWGAFWAEVAETLADAPGVLGLNIINEPFPGNFYEDPSLLIPDVADRKRLQPAYDTVAEHIRAVAPDALIFFAGTTWDRTGRITDKLPLGFEHPPGGNEFANRSVNSFHFYTPPQSAEHAKSYFQQRLKDARRLGTGLFLTETCCDFFFEDAAPAVDSLGLSWLHWEWKPFCKNSTSSESQAGDFGACKTGSGGWPFADGVFIESMYRALARPYAQAIAGNFSFAHFGESGHFRLEFLADPNIKKPTVLSTPDIIYPAGFSLVVSPPDACDIEYLTGIVHLRSKSTVAFGEKVIVQVFPKGQELVV
ncbi:unnamed protein product [Cladocopium goreaui]|uniref:Endoglycoceramidase n=1 Tax=Cladocopium goreaui TaxID=2562237 RepID=A0A9P1FIU9_9DINO|nr:unnamed protein product [Cladocopium goreaui]